MDTVLCVVRLRCRLLPLPHVRPRAYPRDRKLGIQGRSLSPGVRRTVAWLGNLRLISKRVKRSSEGDGEKVRATSRARPRR